MAARCTRRTLAALHFVGAVLASNHQTDVPTATRPRAAAVRLNKPDPHAAPT
eukprot:gene3762-4166_t